MDDIIKMLNDRFEGWELADFLGVTAEDVALAFEDIVEEKMAQLKELLEIEDDDDDEQDND
jgi:DNA-directed RNA polymerase specialized sigma subunit